MARKDSNWKHILFIVLMYAVTVPALYAYLAWNKVDTPFAYEFLQRLGIAGVENLSDAGVRDLWFFEMSQFYGVATGISLLMVVIWNVIFWKAGAPGRRSLENILFAVFIALHILMTLLVAIISGHLRLCGLDEAGHLRRAGLLRHVPAQHPLCAVAVAVLARGDAQRAVQKVVKGFSRL